MTFEQADRLTDRIISFLKGLGGHYETVSEDRLAMIIIPCLAARQFVLKIDRKGIRYFACYWKTAKEELDAILHEEETPIPKIINSGTYLYVSEVGSRGEPGDGREMIRRLRKKEEHRISGVYWHQPHRDYRICRWKEG